MTVWHQDVDMIKEVHKLGILLTINVSYKGVPQIVDTVHKLMKVYDNH